MGRPEQGRLLLRERSQFLPLPYYCYADATFWGFERVYYLYYVVGTYTWIPLALQTLVLGTILAR